MILLRFILNPLGSAFIIKNEFSSLQMPKVIFTLINNFTIRYFFFFFGCNCLDLSLNCSHLTRSQFIFFPLARIYAFLAVLSCISLCLKAAPNSVLNTISLGRAYTVVRKESACPKYGLVGREILRSHWNEQWNVGGNAKVSQ